MFVGWLEMVPAGKSGSKHQDSAFWRMEVRNKGVNHFKFDTRVEEDVVFAGSFAGSGPELERASDGGANGNNAMAGSFGSLDGFNGVFWEVEPFGMHFVLFDVIGANWEESAEADMECEIFNLDAFFLELFKQFFCHVETGGWSGGGAEILGPDGLVAFDIFFFGLAMHIWGKRNVAEILRDFFERTSGSCGRSAVAEDFFDSNNICCQFTGCNVFDDELFAFVKFATIHNVVDFAVVAFEHDELAWVAVRFAFGEDTAAHDAGIVEDNEIARLQKVGQVCVATVGIFAGFAIQDEQASSAADFWRMLGDDFLWKIVIKI